MIFISIFQITKAMSPDSVYRYTPDSLGLSYENIRISTSDSYHLNAWLMTPAPAYDKSTTLIISGGDAGNMGNYVYQSYLLVMQGYTVITYDYRGFGKSDSFNINHSMLYHNEFSNDLKAVIQYARNRNTTHTIGLLSYSMGTIVSIMTVQSSPVDFMIMEGLVQNPLKVAARLQLQQNKILFLPDSAHKIMGYYSQTMIPMLIFAGDQDRITTALDAKLICDLSSNRQLIVFSGGHLEGLSVLSKKSLGDVYLKKLLKFIKKLK